MKKVLRIFVIALKITIPVLILAILAVCGVIFYYLSKIPDVSKIDSDGYELVSKLYTKDGKHIQDYYEKTRYYIPLNDIPKHTINAFLAAEDAYFFENIGVDFRGIFRATIQNIRYKIFGNGGMQGASTITQQLVKNVLLTNEKTFDRKIKEILLSVIITREVSKEKILELYLNYIFFGSSAYGIESAALEYFGKHAHQLNIQESATLAAMPKAPSVINPRINYERTLARRNWVIDQMFSNNFINFQDAETAKNSKIDLVEDDLYKEIYGGYNSISQHIALNEVKKLNLPNLYTSGYLIKTTIDSQMQEKLFSIVTTRIDAYQKKYNKPTNQVKFRIQNWCEELKAFKANYSENYFKYGVVLKNNGRYNVLVGYVKNNKCLKVQSIALEHVPTKGSIVVIEEKSAKDIKKLRLPPSVEKTFAKKPFLTRPIPQPNAGAVVMNLQNGKILAMVGDYFNTPNGFNRATQAQRQVGSTIKPFVYLTALENGFSPASKFIDAPLTLGRNWKPENHSNDYLGSITLRKSLERSRNITTVRIADSVGVDAIKKTFINFAFVSPRQEFDLSSALGSTSLTPMQLLEAYTVFSNGGQKIDPVFVEYIQDRKGKIIFQNKNITCEACSDDKKIPSFSAKTQGLQLISQEVAFQIHSILEGATKRGTSWQVGKWLGEGFAGKTGTTSNSKDSWFIGYNGSLIMVVYVGFDNSTSLGEREYGATLALPIFIDFMRSFINKYPSKIISPPQTLQKILINKDTGKRANSKDSDGVIVEYFKESDKIPEFPSQENVKLYGY